MSLSIALHLSRLNHLNSCSFYSKHWLCYKTLAWTIHLQYFSQWSFLRKTMSIGIIIYFRKIILDGGKKYSFTLNMHLAYYDSASSARMISVSEKILKHLSSICKYCCWTEFLQELCLIILFWIFIEKKKWWYLFSFKLFFDQCWASK